MDRAFNVALVGIIVVFIVLVLIILLIKLYSSLITWAGKNKGNTAKKTTIETKESNPVSESNHVMSVDNNMEIVAVITAAVMACMQGSSSSLRVRSIKRIGHTTPIWNIAGRNEQILSKI
ncbi:MAG: oxaloacetate decarboxylase, gamma chain [Clostridiaceae bacterium]|nr:oxaloacetate decarboxylase, gamma chain [Clostridiaceae bacterium]